VVRWESEGKKSQATNLGKKIIFCVWLELRVMRVMIRGKILRGVGGHEDSKESEEESKILSNLCTLATPPQALHTGKMNNCQVMCGRVFFFWSYHSSSDL
jgi:hypothetical protein